MDCKALRNTILALCMTVCLCGVSRAQSGGGAKLITVIEQNDQLFIGAAAGMTLRYDLVTGEFNIFRQGGEVTVYKAASVIHGGATATQQYDYDFKGAEKMNWYVEDIAPDGATGTRVVITRERPDLGVAFVQQITTYRTVPGAVFRAGVINRSDKDFVVADISPLSVSFLTKSAVFLGIDPANAKIFESPKMNCCSCIGYPREQGGPPDTANYIAAYDETAGRGVAAGFISAGNADVNRVGLSSPDRNYPQLAVRDPDTERMGSDFYSKNGYCPDVIVHPGETFVSEALGFVQSWIAPLAELEALGRLAALERQGEKRLAHAPSIASFQPVQGGAGVSHVLAAIDDAANKLGAYGLDTFFLDRVFTLDDFASEGEAQTLISAASKKAKDKGLRIGIRFDPFAVSKTSPVLESHPGWFSKNDSEVRINESSAEAAAYISNIIKKVHGGLGVEFFEIPKLSTARKNSASAFLSGVFRKPGSKVILSGPVGVLPDSLLDIRKFDPQGFFVNQHSEIEPKDAKQEFFAVNAFNRAAKSWFFNNNSGVLRLPPFSFKTEWKEPVFPKAWFSAVGLLGAAAEVADPVASLSEEQLDTVRRVMPSWESAAAPVDLFAGNIYERLNLKVKTAWGKWNVVGLFNVGNEGGFNDVFVMDNPADITSSRINYEKIFTPATDTKTIPFTFEELGLAPAGKYLVYDFWKGELLGEFTGGTGVPVEPMCARVLVVRAETPVPQLVNSNRHITSGGYEIPVLNWDEQSSTLSGELKAVAGFNHTLTFRAPAPYRLVSANIDGKDASATYLEGYYDIFSISHTPSASGTVKWSLMFSK